jgi:hypothetical protein
MTAKRLIPVLFATVALLVATLLSPSAPASGQTSWRWMAPGATQSRAPAADSDAEASQDRAPRRWPRGMGVAGRVRSIDTAASTVTLDDGTVLRLPPDVQRRSEHALRGGVTVEAAYEDQGGHKIVRDLRITGR